MTEILKSIASLMFFATVALSVGLILLQVANFVGCIKYVRKNKALQDKTVYTSVFTAYGAAILVFIVWAAVTCVVHFLVTPNFPNTNMANAVEIAFFALSIMRMAMMLIDEIRAARKKNFAETTPDGEK